MEPACDLTIFVESRFDMLCVYRMVKACARIFFPGPGEMNRCADRFRAGRRLVHVVAHEFTPKGTASHHHVHGDGSRFHSKKLRQCALNARRIDHYGATNPAEFFAVATETFFEQPAAMAREHQALYAALERYYRVDPRHWHAHG